MQKKWTELQLLSEIVLRYKCEQTLEKDAILMKVAWNESNMYNVTCSKN
jgi:hypothetical protein